MQLSAQNQVKSKKKETLHHESFVDLAPAALPGFAPEHLKINTEHLPPKAGLVTPLGTTKHSRAHVLSACTSQKKVIYRVLLNKDMAKWQVLKFSEKDIVKFLNIEKLRSFVGHW